MSTGAQAVLRRDFREGRKTCLCCLSPSAQPSCTLQGEVSVIWALTRPYWQQFSWYSTCIFPFLLSASSPYQTLIPPPACSYNLLGLVAEEAGSEKTKSLINVYCWNITWSKISVPFTRCISNTEGNISGPHFGPILPWEERSFWQLCKHKILHAKVRSDPDLTWKPVGYA